MSTITLDYPNSLSVRRRINVRWIILFMTGLVLVASVILVTAFASVRVDTPADVVAVPVQTASADDVQSAPAATSTPAPSPIVVAVPVATPPSE